MMNGETQNDPFEGFPLEQKIVERAAACRIALLPEAAAGLAGRA